MRYVNRSFLLSALVILATWAAPLSAQPYAVIQDLGTLGGATSSGFRVNNSGGVIGYSTLPGESADLAFYHNGSSMQSISLGGTSSTATDVNDAGMVVGGGFTAGNLEYQAFFFYNGQVRELSLGGTFGNIAGQKKSNLPMGGGKQVGRNQTFGADVNRAGVPRRTGGG